MYWIEAEMEQLGTWGARIELMEDNVAALETLSHDSDQHGDIIKKWLIKANVSIPEEAPHGLPKNIFDFDGMSSPEIFRSIMKYEILAMNVYKDISNARSEIIKDLLPHNNEADEFLNDIEQLIKDEEMHAGICKNQIGGFTKVIY